MCVEFNSQINKKKIKLNFRLQLTAANGYIYARMKRPTHTHTSHVLSHCTHKIRALQKHQAATHFNCRVHCSRRDVAMDGNCADRDKRSIRMKVTPYDFPRTPPSCGLNLTIINDVKKWLSYANK